MTAKNVYLDKEEKEILKFAISYRILMIALCLGVGSVCLEYDTSSSIAYIAPNSHFDSELICKGLSRFLTPLSTRWDAVYYLNIARNGYRYEQEFAFFPGFPLLIRWISSLLLGLVRVWNSVVVLLYHSSHWMTLGSSRCLHDLSYQVAGLGISNISFILAVVGLYRLSLSLGFRTKTCKLAALLMSVAPASIFLSSIYTESLFALFALVGMNLWTKNRNREAALFWFMATCTRSNGILFAGFFMWNLVASSRPSTSSFLKDCVKFTILSLVVVSPFIGFQFYGYQLFCLDSQRPWCSQSIPSIYSFVQTHYWNNGFLRYWRMDQLPNFLLATPVFALHGWALFDYITKDLKRFLSLGYKKRKTPFANAISRASLLPFYYLMAFLLLYVLLFMHVQVIIRFFTWQPLGYLYAASKLNSKISNRLGKAYFYYSVLYGIVGSVLYSVFLPPA